MTDINNIEINFVKHCNNHCVSCSHGAPLRGGFMSVADLEVDLVDLSLIATVGTVDLLGGEPLLHPNLIEALDMIPRYAHQAAVTTNGLLLEQMEPEFWSKFKRMRLSVYHNTPPSAVELAKEKSKEFGFSLHVQPVTDFFYLTNKRADASYNFSHCPFTQCKILESGRLWICPQSELYNSQRWAHDESLDISAATPESLAAFLQPTLPLQSCATCNFTHWHPWRQLERGENFISASAFM